MHLIKRETSWPIYYVQTVPVNGKFYLHTDYGWTEGNDMEGLPFMRRNVNNPSGYWEEDDNDCLNPPNGVKQEHVDWATIRDTQNPLREYARMYKASADVDRFEVEDGNTYRTDGAIDFTACILPTMGLGSAVLLIVGEQSWCNGEPTWSDSEPYIHVKKVHLDMSEKTSEGLNKIVKEAAIDLLISIYNIPDGLDPKSLPSAINSLGNSFKVC